MGDKENEEKDDLKISLNKKYFEQQCVPNTYMLLFSIKSDNQQPCEWVSISHPSSHCRRLSVLLTVTYGTNGRTKILAQICPIPNWHNSKRNKGKPWQCVGPGTPGSEQEEWARAWPAEPGISHFHSQTLWSSGPLCEWSGTDVGLRGGTWWMT